MTKMMAKTTSPMMAPEWPRNRFRTICPWLRPLASRTGSMPAAGCRQRRVFGHDFVLLTWLAHAFTLTRGSSAEYARSAMRLKPMAVMATQRKTPITGLGSTCTMPSRNRKPIPRTEKTVSVMTAPPISAADVEGHDRGDRDQRVAEGMAHDDGPFRQALGPGGPDVVHVHDFQHRGAGEPGVAGQRNQDERHGRQDQVREGVQAQGPEVAFDVRGAGADGGDGAAADPAVVEVRGPRLHVAVQQDQEADQERGDARRPAWTGRGRSRPSGSRCPCPTRTAAIARSTIIRNVASLSSGWMTK